MIKCYLIFVSGSIIITETHLIINMKYHSKVLLLTKNNKLRIDIIIKEAESNFQNESIPEGSGFVVFSVKITLKL
jgi:hypothetical protein